MGKDASIARINSVFFDLVAQSLLILGDLVPPNPIALLRLQQSEGQAIVPFRASAVPGIRIHARGA